MTVVPKVTTDAFYADYNPRFEGVFRVKAPNMPDSIDISIDITHYIPGTSLLDRIVIFNHDGLGSSINFGSDWYNYRQIWFDNNYGYTKSYFINNLDKTIELYLECNQGYVCTNYHYKGRKLN